MNEAAQIDYAAVMKRGWEGFIRKPVEIIVGMFIAQLSMLLIITIGPAMLGIARAGLAAVRGETVEIGTSLEGYKHFGGALVLGLLMGILLAVGFIACILPGVALMVVLQWSFFIMADDPEIGAVDAMKASLDLAKANIGAPLIAIIVNLVLSMAGSMVVVGGIVTTPIGMCIAAAIYDAVRNPAEARNAGSAGTPPSAPTV